MPSYYRNMSEMFRQLWRPSVFRKADNLEKDICQIRAERCCYRHEKWEGVLPYRIAGEIGVCTVQEERKIRFGNLRSSLWKINNRRFHLVICVLEYHHLSPSSANVSTVSQVRPLNARHCYWTTLYMCLCSDEHEGRSAALCAELVQLDAKAGNVRQYATALWSQYQSSG